MGSGNPEVAHSFGIRDLITFRDEIRIKHISGLNHIFGIRDLEFGTGKVPAFDSGFGIQDACESHSPPASPDHV